MKGITVKYRGQLSTVIGKTEENMEAGSVEAVLKTLRKRYGRKAEKAARIMLIAVNGESILLLKQFKTILKEGDVLNFFPLSAGG